MVGLHTSENIQYRLKYRVKIVHNIRTRLSGAYGGFTLDETET